MSKLKVLCVADSLGLPGHSKYEDTWFALLKNNFPSIDFISVFQRATTTNVLLTIGGGSDNIPRGADCLEFYEPDIVILQLGIVDCAPRYISKNSKVLKIVNRLPAIGKKIFYKILKSVRNRSVKHAEVSPEKFRANIETYLKRCETVGVKKVVVIKIVTPDERMAKKNPTIKLAVNLYNTIYDSFVDKFNFYVTIDPLNYDFIQEDIFEDGYHPNQRGNLYVFNELKETLFPLTTKC